MRSIPTITKNLLIINFLMFVATFVFQRGGIDLNYLLGLHFFMASDFHLYQLLTYMFMHGGLQHIFFNMFALWMFGCVVENVWGPKKFLFYYISCGIGAGLIQELVQYISYFAIDGLNNYEYVNLNGVSVTVDYYLNQLTTVGASGAIYGILLAFGMLFPEERIFIFPLPVPIKAKWFILAYVGIELFSALGTSGDGVAHFAHLGGMLFGFLMIRYWKKHPDGGGGYGRSGGQQFFDRLRNNWEKRSHKKADDNGVHSHTESDKDWQYNQQKQANQKEIDDILDKIRRSGYDSLTEEEKKKLFDAGKNR
ncbi:MAG: rhomboid family intramembrane serine protease [Prevotella sp.]|nr:rhomboid family intramembrane serine protease [Prevotella sp.]